MLGLRRELADRHVFDHAPAQRAHRLVGHGDAPVLSEGLLTPHLQDRAPPPAIAFDAPAAAPPYRASGLVLWPFSTVRAWQQNGSDWGNGGRATDIAESTFLTQSDRLSARYRVAVRAALHTWRMLEEIA